jgi:adenosylcobinamide-GDP ribazoletransferase
MIKSLVLMIQFLTKFPVPINLKVDDADFQRGIVWFPLVGFLIGGSMFLIYTMTSLVWPTFVTVVLLVAFQIFITGGLHLDGLADTFDGLYSYRNKEEMLEIMKDSRVGTNGVLVLIVAILLKTTLLFNLISQDYLWVIILMPVFSRSMGVFLAYIGVYARKKGMGGFFIGHTTLSRLILAMVICLLLSLIYWKSLFLIPLMLLFTWLYNFHVKSKIDGITGDVIGAWIEMSEIIFLMVVTIL